MEEDKQEYQEGRGWIGMEGKGGVVFPVSQFTVF